MSKNAIVKPTQWVKDKYAKDNALAVCSSAFDFDSKSIKYILETEDFKEKTVTAEDICRSFYWKSFKAVNNGLEIEAEPMSEEEIKALYKDYKVIGEDAKEEAEG